MTQPSTASEASVLIVADFAENVEKVERHVGPVGMVAEPTLLCVDAPDDVAGVTVASVSPVGIRPLDLLALSVVAVLEALRGEYELVGSYSLLPYGVIALIAGRAAGVPTHLGVIGSDIDVHATARYGAAVRWLMSRFTVVSVTGRTHRDRLAELGVTPGAVETLANPIRPAAYPVSDDTERSIDLLWVGRFGPEKNPVRFVDIVDRLTETVAGDLRVVMLGTGVRREAVEAEIRRRDLADIVERPGWVPEPATYYRRARVYVLTSEREGLPLTLIEAMASGVPAVVPDVGNVRDPATDGDNALVVADNAVEPMATAVQRLLTDEALRSRLATNATDVREHYSYDAAAADWRGILEAAGVYTSSSESTVESPAVSP